MADELRVFSPIPVGPCRAGLCILYPPPPKNRAGDEVGICLSAHCTCTSKSYRTFPPQSYRGSGMVPARPGAASRSHPHPGIWVFPDSAETAACQGRCSATRGRRAVRAPSTPHGEPVSNAGNRWGGGQDKPPPARSSCALPHVSVCEPPRPLRLAGNFFARLRAARRHRGTT